MYFFPYPAAFLLILCSPAAILPALLFAAGTGYLAFRYFSLKHALRQIHRDLSEILEDISQNRILHLPAPDPDLEGLTQTVNSALEEIRRERLSYEKRERQFQGLIENISHDLRTPLTVILGYLKWMKHTDSTKSPSYQSRPPALSPETTLQTGSSEHRYTLDIIEKHARAMEKLVSQFYAFSRLHAQDYALELQSVDICRILRESIADHCRILEERNLEIRSRLPEHAVLIRGNADALERIFSNLLQNAGRYAYCSLEIRLESEDLQNIRVVFQNDTTLIKEDDIPHLFDRFYKRDPSRRQGGSGLGLTVAKSLAELMDGSLTAELSGQAATDDEPSPAPFPKMASADRTAAKTSEMPEAAVICFTLTFPKPKKLP